MNHPSYVSDIPSAIGGSVHHADAILLNVSQTDCTAAKDTLDT